MLSSVQLANMVKDLGPVGASRQLNHLLGIYNPETKARNVDSFTGANCLESADIKLMPSECSLKQLYECFCPGDPGFNNLLRARGRTFDALEEGATEIGPSVFANVSAYNAAALGLLEAKFLDAYRRAAFLSDQLAMTVPSDKIQEMFIGVSMIGDVAIERKPGNRHARVTLSERYVRTQINVNNAISVDVTREAVMFDRTRELLKMAESAAETLALRKEYRILDVFLGNTNTYNYNGTTYNTYATSGNWINQLSGSSYALADWTEINLVLQLFSAMTDQETGQPIDIQPKDLFVMPANYLTARHILYSSQVQARTPTTQAVVAVGENPVAEFRFNLIGSPTYPYAKKRLVSTDATGGSVSASNADTYWFMGDFKKAFVYPQNMPVTTLRASTTDYEMADRGLIFSLFADEMGSAGVLEPRQVVQVIGHS